MDIEFDPDKNLGNYKKHGFYLSDAGEFEFETALIKEDGREDYGERRYQALGLLEDKVVMLVFTRRKKTLRAISLRPANARERKGYEEAQEKNS